MGFAAVLIFEAVVPFWNSDKVLLKCTQQDHDHEDLEKQICPHFVFMTYLCLQSNHWL